MVLSVVGFEVVVEEKLAEVEIEVINELAGFEIIVVDIVQFAVQFVEVRLIAEIVANISEILNFERLRLGNPDWRT